MFHHISVQLSDIAHTGATIDPYKNFSMLKLYNFGWFDLDCLVQALVVFGLCLLWAWQWEKSRRVKFLLKLTSVNPSITNENAREKIKEYKNTIKMLQYSFGNKSNTWQYPLGVLFTFILYFMGATIFTISSTVSVFIFWGFCTAIFITTFARALIAPFN